MFCRNTTLRGKSRSIIFKYNNDRKHYYQLLTNTSDQLLSFYLVLNKIISTILSFNSYNNIMREMLLLPVTRWEDWGTKNVSILLGGGGGHKATKSWRRDSNPGLSSCLLCINLSTFLAFALVSSFLSTNIKSLHIKLHLKYETTHL